MRGTVIWFTVALLMLPVFTPAQAANLSDKVKVEIESVALHRDLDPGMYVCAAGHLHIRGTVQNLAGVALGQITVAGQAFDAEGRLLGTATASPRRPVLRPNEKARIDLEFLTVVGPRIRLVKRHKVTVTEARPRQ